MNLPIYPDFISALNEVRNHFKDHGSVVQTESWQGVKNPIEFFEVLNVSFSAIMPKDKLIAVRQIMPNLPWAQQHFNERVGGDPLNPGEQYKNWPYFKNDASRDRFRTSTGEKFSHTYMERFWPKQAGELSKLLIDTHGRRKGIRYCYGDFDDVIKLLQKEPYTRQAYLPIWFPEDTGATESQRVPCTLGYHFIRRGDKLNVTYYIRSCDFIRHFRDDIYMCYLLVDYIISYLICHLPGDDWNNVTPGIFTMHITSLHIFAKEQNLLKD